MRRAKIRFTAAYLLSLAFLTGGAAAGQEYWVSAAGNDSAAGTKDMPFATLERARDVARGMKKIRGVPKGGVTVWLQRGIYEISKTFELNDTDSGTVESPVVYRSVPGEQVRLVGGRQIPSSAFKPATNPDVLKRLDPSAHGSVLQADLKTLGITDYGKLTRRGGIERSTLPAAMELFFNDRPTPLARWPNQGWTRIAAVPEGPAGERFRYDGDRPKRWSKAQDIWVHGYMNRNWCDTYEQVAVLDSQSREIATRESHDYRGYKTGQRFRFLNVLEELDEPGEWYVDRAAGVLYFWPPEPIAQGRVCISLLETPLAALRRTEYVTLEGLVLECTRGCAVGIGGGGHNRVAGCTLVKVENNVTEGDTGLVAPEKGDLRLREDSPALKLGFQPIPFDKIGLYRDEYRFERTRDLDGEAARPPETEGGESASLGRMRQRQLEHVTLVYAPESEGNARDIIPYAAQCNQRLAQWFQPAAPVAQKVYWMARKDWRNKPETYGFPYANGSDAYLPASDVDLPTQLTYIADSMAIPAGGPSVDRMIRLLQLPEGTGPAELYAQLKQSREFFFVFTAYFILPHELTHGFCNHLAYPQQPRWCYEGIAQWAAYKIQGQLRSPREADMIDQYYQLLWERGTGLKVRDFARADKLGAGDLDTPNYAWYHAGLLRMFRQLEEMKGGELLPALLEAIGRRHLGAHSVPQDQMIQTFSEVIGQDLKPWFKERWNLGSTSR